MPTRLLHFDIDDRELPDELTSWSDTDAVVRWAWARLGDRVPALTLEQLRSEIDPNLPMEWRSRDWWASEMAELYGRQREAIAPVSQALLAASADGRQVSRTILRDLGVTREMVETAISHLREYWPRETAAALGYSLRDGPDGGRRPDQPVLHRHPDAAVFAGKAVIEALELDKSPRAEHFGALRGRNAWEDRNSVLVIGREQPAPQDIETIARAYAAAAGHGFRSGDYIMETRGIRTRDGCVPLDVYRHPDPWGDRVLQQVREAEIVQAIDRDLRAMDPLHLPCIDTHGGCDGRHPHPRMIEFRVRQRNGRRSRLKQALVLAGGKQLLEVPEAVVGPIDERHIQNSDYFQKLLRRTESNFFARLFAVA